MVVWFFFGRPRFPFGSEALRLLPALAGGLFSACDGSEPELAAFLADDRVAGILLIFSRYSEGDLMVWLIELMVSTSNSRQ